MDTSEQSSEELILALLADGSPEFTSGEALSDKLGLSRAAVWKNVESLRRKGYRIEAMPAKGYRLAEIPDRLTPLELTPLLQTQEIGRVLHYREELESTNELAFQLAVEGAAHGEVVIADRQTRGKGRRGRGWSSPPNLNLYCSIVLRPELPPQRSPEITLVAAVALAQSLNELDAPARIKWPNDLQVEGRKVAGILTELSADPDQIHFAILGLGINLNGGRSDFPPELQASATSVSEVIGHRISRAPFAALLWKHLESWLRTHAERGFPPVRAAWKRAEATLGKKVRIQEEGRLIEGTAVDIDDSGALLVKNARGQIERVVAGDLEQAP